MDNIVVTGGSGFLGRRLQKYYPNWRYLSSKDYDLSVYSKAQQAVDGADTVLHLAGRVGGIKDNAENQADYFDENILMNTNIVKACKKKKVKRLLCALSTCAWPDTLPYYPFAEEQILDGAPSKTNLSYSFAKRALYIQTISYREQYGLDYNCFAPCNLYGPEADFDSDKSHFIAAMIDKINKVKPGEEVEFWGTGWPIRQHLYVDDLVAVMPELIRVHKSQAPLIIAPSESFSIREIIDTFLKVSGKKVKIDFNGQYDGQYRKDGSNYRFRRLFPKFEFTSLKDGLKLTQTWYRNTQRHNLYVKGRKNEEK